MTIPKILSFQNYNHYEGETNPTTDAQMQTYMDNQNQILIALSKRMWQPQTSYSVGAVVYGDTMPPGVVAIVTVAGTTGNSQPTWREAGTVGDGSVRYEMRQDVGNYLPLSGGTITGAINYSGANAVGLKRLTDDSSLNLYGGTNYQNCGYITLEGKDYTNGSRVTINARADGEANAITLNITNCTITKDVVVGSNVNVNRYIYAQNSAVSGGILASSAGNIGVWDRTHAKWVIYNDASGNTYTTTPATSDNSNKVATTAFVKNNNALLETRISTVETNALKSQAQSFAENGYEQLSNGLLLQWGKTTDISSNTSITFPVTFTNVFNVTATPIVSGGNFNASGNNMSIKTVSNNGFTAGSADTSRGYAGFYWMAIGKK